MRRFFFGLIWCFVVGLVGLSTVFALGIRSGHFASDFLWGSTGGKSEFKKEKMTLPSGEVISNDSFLIDGFQDADLSNSLSFQSSPSAPKEKMGPEIEYAYYGQENDSLIPVSQAKVLYRDASRLMIAIRHLLFVRTSRPGVTGEAIKWEQFNENPSHEAELFMQSTLERDDPRLNPAITDNINYAIFINGTGGAYDCVGYDANQKLLTTQRVTDVKDYPKFLSDHWAEANNYPKYLVYHWDFDSRYGPAYGPEQWFDVESTRKANGLNPPADPHLAIEVSIIEYPGATSSPLSRNELLVLPGAHEALHQAIPLSGSEWRSFNFSHPDYRRVVADHRYEVRYGFADPTPDSNSIFLRADEVYGEELKSMKPDQWMTIGAWGPQEGPAKSVFLCLRRSE